MSEYENWFSVRFPNIQATIDQSNDQESKLLKLACKEVWQHRQAIIDDLRSQLNNMEQCYIEKKKECEELQKRIEVASSRISGICRFINEDNPRCVDALAVTVDCELIRIESYLRGAND